MISLSAGVAFPNSLQAFAAGAGTAIFYFTIYSFMGWVLENGYSFIMSRQFFKPNFLRGPFKPMYGFAPVMLVCLITENTHWAVVMLLCFFIPTLVEYVSGFLLEKLSQRKWWDYSGMSLNFQGHICLVFSVCWIFLSILCLRYIHPELQFLYKGIESYWNWVWPVAYGYFMIELFKAIQRHAIQAVHSKERNNSLQ